MNTFYDRELRMALDEQKERQKLGEIERKERTVEGKLKIQKEERKSCFYFLIEYLQQSIFQLQNKKSRDIRFNQGLEISWKNEKQKTLVSIGY